MSEQREFWNSKFRGEEHFYGTRPNAYIKEKSFLIRQGGKVLCLGEGEGRNALYLANEGHDITAIDASDVGLEKARKLTLSHGHTIETIHMDLALWHPEADQYDAVATSYLHLPQPLRKEVLVKSISTLKKGGFFIGEFFSQEQLAFSSGGPKDPELLYSVEDMRQNLEGLDAELLELAREETDLDEGVGHVGPASVVRVVFKKL